MRWNVGVRHTYDLVVVLPLLVLLCINSNDMFCLPSAVSLNGVRRMLLPSASKGIAEGATCLVSVDPNLSRARSLKVISHRVE